MFGSEAEKSLVQKDEISLAILGMVDGNGHPYSWSAIFNGYDREEMKYCPYAGIPAYLEKEPKDTLRIGGARVTHIWTDNPDDAKRVSKASLIENVVEKPEDVIGKVDAVIIATDKGYEHVERCRPFIEAGIPVFVDKPLVDNENNLEIFSEWVQEGAKTMSSSCMRYCKEFMPYRLSTNELGSLRYVNMTMTKTWEGYGIHALEAIYPILGSGFVSVQNTGTYDNNITHIKHSSEVDINVSVIGDLYGGFGALQLVGTAGKVQTAFSDTFFHLESSLNRLYNICAPESVRSLSVKLRN